MKLISVNFRFRVCARFACNKHCGKGRVKINMPCPLSYRKKRCKTPGSTAWWMGKYTTVIQVSFRILRARKRFVVRNKVVGYSRFRPVWQPSRLFPSLPAMTSQHFRLWSIRRLFNYLADETGELCVWKTAKRSKRNKLARSFERFEPAVQLRVYSGPGSDK